MKRIVAFGECMIELSGGLGTTATIAYGGDTLNTAIYLARLGHHPAYATALGDDSWSDELRTAWAAEGIDCSLSLAAPGRLPGLYAIKTTESGERSFSYWRSESAARQFFESPGVDEVLAEMARADLLYISGISLSLFDASSHAKLAAVAQAVRANGGDVAFDPNYRARGWQNPEAARQAFAAFAPTVSIALTGRQDEAALFGDTDLNTIIERWQAAGAKEVVIKDGDSGATVATSAKVTQVPSMPVADVCDTTGAGDSFNAGYLAGRLEGRTVLQSADLGTRLAAEVVRHPGAIIPRIDFDRAIMNGASNAFR